MYELNIYTLSTLATAIADSREYDKKKNQIIFSKALTETGEVLESSVYNAKTGDKVE